MSGLDDFLEKTDLGEQTRDELRVGREVSGARRNDVAQEVELVVAVDDDGRAGGVGGPEVLDALVVAQEVNALVREPGLQGQAQLTGGDDVEAEPLLGDHAQELRRREGLGRIKHLAARTHGRHVLGRPPAHGRLVVDVQGRAMAAGQLDEVAAPNLHVAGGVDPVRDREQQVALA